jgi:hypothetical protein
MAEKDPRVNIKPFTDEGPVVWSEKWISNGHFLVDKSLVKFGDHLTSDDAITVAFPKATSIVKKTDAEMIDAVKPAKRPHVYTRSQWGTDQSAMFVDDEGNVAWISRDYADAFDLGVLFGIDDKSTFYTAPEMRLMTIAVAPMTVSPAWSELRKVVARYKDAPVPPPAKKKAAKKRKTA